VSGGEPALLQISSRRWRFITRQIEGNYPNWRQVIPNANQFNTTVELKPSAIETILALIPRIPCHDLLNHTLGLMVEGKKVILRGRGSNDSKWTDLEVEGAAVKGKPVTIYLNRQFLTKALKFGMGTIQIIDALSPMRLSSGGKQMIIMPVRAQEPAPPAAAPEETSAPEESGKDEVSPVGSEAEQQTERSTTMPKTINSVAENGNGNGHQQHDATTKPAVEVALEKIETIKCHHREAIRGLNDLTDTLKQVQREQKTTVKEVQSVRTTLEKLQQVRI
jgi:hypothetical protein